MKLKYRRYLSFRRKTQNNKIINNINHIRRTNYGKITLVRWSCIINRWRRSN